ncbi:MFS transporter [Mucilaginibacter sp. RS28]|uniref:MFS transporter n=1 Tax=Mucilaginibacter straminoryzae TaxID=2932774 RepID=A0A9X1X3R4_9SPHI|nr:MFS transporter [Mucilaginibacter straminoryzae]MCJ8209083.1 MFS transporter [Mucilaginibacter straminoryzae]
MNPITLYRKAYSGLSRNSWLLTLVVFINRSGTMVLPFMTIYCTQALHFSIRQAGVVMAMFGLGSITGAFIGGKITDRYGFYDVQIGSLLSAGLLFILLGYQTHFYAICACTFILSLCNDAFRPANSTAIAHYSSPENKTRSYSLNRLAVNLGWSFGGAIGGFLAAHNYHLLFWVDGCTNLLSGVMLMILMPRANAKRNLTQRHHTAQSSPYKDGVYMLFILFVVLFAFCFFQIFTLQPVFYKTEWHLTEQLIGGLMALNGFLVAFVEMVLIHNLEGRRHPMQYICFGIFLTAIGLTLVNWMPAMALTGVMSIILVSFGEMFSMPFMNAFWISRTNEHNRGQYAALYTIAWSTAQVLAPALGSQIIAFAGYQSLWWTLGAICLLSIAGFYGLYQKRLKTVKVAPEMLLPETK